MNEPNFSEAFLKANQKANIFITDIGEPKFQIDIERKNNNTFLAVGITIITLYIVALVFEAKNEANKNSSNFKRYQ